MISNSKHLSFGIVLNLDLTKMGYGNALFSHTSGAMFQGYVKVKLGSVHHLYAHYLTPREYMYSASFLNY